MNIKTIDEEAIGRGNSVVPTDVKHWNTIAWSPCKSVDGIWKIPTSVLFCDPQVKFSVLPMAKIGLYRAIRAKKVFHIYLHPHDLLSIHHLRRIWIGFLGLWQRRGMRER